MSGRKLRNSEDARRFVLGVEMPAAELAVRIIEAHLGLRRPQGKSAEQCLAEMDEDMVRGAMRAGEAAARFFAECVSRSAGLQ